MNTHQNIILMFNCFHTRNNVLHISVIEEIVMCWNKTHTLLYHHIMKFTNIIYFWNTLFKRTHVCWDEEWPIVKITPSIISFIAQRVLIRDYQQIWFGRLGNALLHKINIYATGFKWPQATFAYNIIFARHLNISTWFKQTLLFQEQK